MNLWTTLGMSPWAGLAAATFGLAAAFVLARATLWRRSRAEPRGRLGLHDGDH